LRVAGTSHAISASNTMAAFSLVLSVVRHVFFRVRPHQVDRLPRRHRSAASRRLSAASMLP
jgi:hypothetical protein